MDAGKTLQATLAVVVLVGLLGGCAARTPKQQGRITSSPPGAKIYLYETITQRKELLGKTPLYIEVRQGAWNMKLIAEKDGYESQRKLLPYRGKLDHHFNLRKITE